jgi:hypothetical protein
MLDLFNILACKEVMKQVFLGVNLGGLVQG